MLWLGKFIWVSREVFLTERFHYTTNLCSRSHQLLWRGKQLLRANDDCSHICRRLLLCVHHCPVHHGFSHLQCRPANQGCQGMSQGNLDQVQVSCLWQHGRVTEGRHGGKWRWLWLRGLQFIDFLYYCSQTLNDRLVNPETPISPYGFFYLSHSGLMSSFVTIMTYMIVLLQFKQGSK